VLLVGLGAAARDARPDRLSAAPGVAAVAGIEARRVGVGVADVARSSGADGAVTARRVRAIKKT